MPLESIQNDYRMNETQIRLQSNIHYAIQNGARVFVRWRCSVAGQKNKQNECTVFFFISVYFEWKTKVTVHTTFVWPQKLRVFVSQKMEKKNPNANMKYKYAFSSSYSVFFTGRHTYSFTDEWFIRVCMCGFVSMFHLKCTISF